MVVELWIYDFTYQNSNPGVHLYAHASMLQQEFCDIADLFLVSICVGVCCVCVGGGGRSCVVCVYGGICVYAFSL